MRSPLLKLTLSLVLLGWACAASAARAEMKQAAFVIDANTGAVLHEQFADAPRHPASLTKMMTLYLAFEAIKAGRATADTLLSISERAAGVAPSKLELPAGDQIALGDAVKALITKSANDVAVAIAENLGGTEANFVELMNAKARDLGMSRTHFTNASGLPDEDQISTARDMVTLGMRLADDFPDYFRLFSMRQFEYRGKVYKSHNTLLHGFPGMDGIKTGYTRMSGFNLVSSVHLEGKHVVAAVFGGTTSQTRNAHMRSLLFQTLEKASTVRTRPKRAPANSAPPLVAKAPEPQLPPVNTALAEVPAPKPQKKSAEKKKQQAKAATPPKPEPVRVAAAAPEKNKAEITFRSTTTDGTIDQIAAVLKEQEQQKQAQAPATTPAPPGDQASEQQASLGPPRLDLEALRNEINNEQSVATTATAEVEPKKVAFATASTAGAPAVPPPAASPTTEEASAASAQGAAKPEAQTVAKLPEPSHLSGPNAATTEGPSVQPESGAYAIQIGAFGSEKEAMSRLEAVRSRANALLQGHSAIAQTATKSGKQIYRARFVAFEEGKATKTCSELRKLAVDCFVMKVD